MTTARIGVIGGSGFYSMEGLTHTEEVRLDTPFGPPSDPLVFGELEGIPVAFLVRHGRGHRLLPSEIPFRANIYGLKAVGVERILSVSAVGSLQERYAPMDLLIPDQFVDRTRQRISTFFGEGVVAHVSFADPVCPEICDALDSVARAVGGIKVHRGGTYLCIEGPAFSTKAESELYRSWGMDIVGMTNLQEAKLAREAEICYATLALVTDYDCWHPDHDSVTADMVVAYLQRNSQNAQRVIRRGVVALDGKPRSCACAEALRNAIITARESIEPATVKRLGALLYKYFPEYKS